MVANAKAAAKFALEPVARAATGHMARILMYHRFGTADPIRQLHPVALEAQLTYLRRHFSVVPLETLSEAICHRKPFPKLAVAVTVDDGYADFVQIAYPVFKRCQVPVTLYLTSGFVNGEIWMWWDAIQFYLQQIQGRHCEVRHGDQSIKLRVTNPTEMHASWLRLAAIGLKLSPDSRNEFIANLGDQLGVRLPASPTADFSASTWQQLRMLDPDIVEFGAHTRTHPILSLCSATRIQIEVAGSKTDVESALDRSVKSFCYPNGGPSDFDSRCKQAVRRAGFESAVVASSGLVRANSDVFALERISAQFRLKDFRPAVSGIAHLRATSTAPGPHSNLPEG